MRVVHFGLGPIGMGAARLAGERGHEAVAAVDVRPELVGRALGEVLGTGSVPATRVTETFPAGLEAEVAIVCTGSSLEAVLGQLLGLVDAGINVVSTCEELSYPWTESPDLAGELDAAARERGVSVLGTGVNPGFAMDYLPIVISAAARRVDRVEVHRVQDAATRRLPLQRKVGAGLTAADFRAGVEAGHLGHVGLRQSARHIASALGWTLATVEERIDPLLAEQAVTGGFGEIAAGLVTGIHQVVLGRVGVREVIRLVLDMAVGLADPRDEVLVSGDPDVRMVIPGGLHGDVATEAVVVNALERVVAAPPGLWVMADLPPPRPIQAAATRQRPPMAG